MEEVIIEFLDIANVKFIGTPELIDLVNRYYPELQNNNATPDYTIKLGDRALPENIKIPQEARFQKCFAGPYYYSWENNGFYLAYAPPEEKGETHLVLRKENNFQVMFNEGKSPKQIIGVSREILIREAFTKGYMPVHASAISKDSKGYIFFGYKNHGKSTSFFSSSMYDGAKPMSGDISFIREESDGWKVMGWPWTATIDQSFFDITHKTPRYNTPSKGKIKYMPADFCREFNTRWVWKRPLEQIVNVNLNPSSAGIIVPITPEDLVKRLEESGTEEWWIWNDVFGLGDVEPIYQYKKLSQDVKGKSLNGNIIQFFKDREREI